MTDETIKDGFDLIEYPCLYKFKAVCKSDVEIDKTISAIVAKTLSSDAVKNSKQRASEKGRFVSVTVQAELKSREELEAVYTALKADSSVIMTM